jgi:hypothetical protein
MARDDFLAVVEALGGWEGFTIGSWRTENSLEPDAFGLPAKRLIIELQPAPDAVRRCGRCGAPVEAVHDVTERRVRDLPLMGSISGSCSRTRVSNARAVARRVSSSRGSIGISG